MKETEERTQNEDGKWEGDADEQGDKRERGMSRVLF